MLDEQVNNFFYWINERHNIYLKRQAGEPWPWTDDEILQTYKFTNPFRENDRVTIWIRENWREPYTQHTNLWFAMAVARQINWPETLAELTPLVFAKKWDAYAAYEIMENRKKAGKQVYTGAYMIRAESDPSREWYNWSKQRYVTEIVLGNVWNARKEFFQNLLNNTLESTTRWFQQFHGWGDFTAYEVVTDLRHTRYLSCASDIMTWANAGPGAKRGINRLYGVEVDKSMDERFAVEVMQYLLAISPDYLEDNVPALEMRDIEMSLCEVDKYMRVLNGEGRPRSLFKPPHMR